MLETRTVTRTALWEDTQNLDGHSDSPSGGTLEQPLRQKDRTYDLSMGLHTYGVIYPAGLRRPELVPTGTQTAFRLYETLFVGGREEARSCMALVCEKGVSLWAAPSTPIYRPSPRVASPRSH